MTITDIVLCFTANLDVGFPSASLQTVGSAPWLSPIGTSSCLPFYLLHPLWRAPQRLAKELQPCRASSQAPCPKLPGTEELAKASCGYLVVPENHNCGYLVVPENHNRPTGRTIRLMIAKYPARSRWQLSLCSVRR